MRRIPQRIRNQIANDPFYRKCIREGEGNCKGRITVEHALMFRGRQLDDLFSLVPCCEFHHFVDLKKEYNRYIALMRATDEDLAKYPKSGFEQMKKYLRGKYGDK